jgi:hypothetical protein
VFRFLRQPPPNCLYRDAVWQRDARHGWQKVADWQRNAEVEAGHQAEERAGITAVDDLMAKGQCKSSNNN